MTRSFAPYDGTRLAYRDAAGPGRLLICLPGGPGRDPDYLGDLGGLGQQPRLVLLELRGSGSSAVPADPATYRCDRMVSDVEELRAHLGLGQLDLLGHSAGGDLALLYAARYPERVSKLILIAPALHSVGLAVTDDELFANMERRSAEPWFADAKAAAQAAFGGDPSTGTLIRYLPFFYGRWDTEAREHAEGEAWQQAPAVAVALFPPGELAVQPGAAHIPWLQDPAWFTATLATFLAR
jgi:pimeloyl-ACP methyl ester carboxylesterase